MTMETNYIYPEESPQDGCMSIVAMTLVFILALLMCVLMGSCRSIQYVPVKEEIHDTVRINKTDTVNHYEVSKEKELVYVKDSSNVVVDETGKVLQKEIWHNKLVIREKSDSIAHYKALVDSLMAVKQREREVPVIIEKPLTKWEQRYMTVGKVSVGIGLGLLIAGIVWLVAWFRRKKIISK